MKTWAKVAVGAGVYLGVGAGVAVWAKKRNGVTSPLAVVGWPLVLWNSRNWPKSTVRAVGVQAATADGAGHLQPLITKTQALGGGLRIVNVPGGVDRVDVAGPVGFAEMGAGR